jgi:hypothetical protein
MQGDDVRVVARATGQHPIPVPDVAIGRAVKAVAADAMPPVELVGKRIEVGALRDRLMKGGVEDRHLRNAAA